MTISTRLLVRRTPTLRALMLSLTVGTLGCDPDVQGGPMTDPEAGSTGGADPSLPDPGPDLGSTSSGGEAESTGAAGTTSGAEPPEGESSGSDTGSAAQGVCGGLDHLGDTAVTLTRGEAAAGACDPAPAPCGGDLVGSWTVAETCGHEALSTPSPVCPEATLQATHDMEGTLTYADDGTFTQAVTVTETFVMSMPVDCIPQTCAELEAAFGLGTTCTLGDEVCTCEGTDIRDLEVAGTWEAADGIVTLDVGGQSQSQPYCVDGDTYTEWTSHDLPWISEQPCEDAQDCADHYGDAHQGYDCHPA